MVLFLVYWVWSLLSFWHSLRDATDMHHLYTTRLGISCTDMHTIEWSEVHMYDVNDVDEGHGRFGGCGGFGRSTSLARPNLRVFMFFDRDIGDGKMDISSLQRFCRMLFSRVLEMERYTSCLILRERGGCLGLQRRACFVLRFLF